jgi:hypothetical protein
MNFKQFYLTEASPEYSTIKMFVDKIEKTMKDFSKNRSRYEKYEYDDGYSIPLKDIIDFKKFPKGGFLDKMVNGELMLAFGDVSHLGTPFLRVNKRQKNGSSKEIEIMGMFSKIDNIIVIPFISKNTNQVFEGKLNTIVSTLLHELTHAAQHARGTQIHPTIGLQKVKWFQDTNEREAILNQIHKEIEQHISNKIKNNKSDRAEFNKTNDKEFIKEYVKVNNELVKMFKDVEEFEKWFNANRWVIRYTNKTLDERIDYLKKFHEDTWDDFILDTYVELKKKFKNVLPTKILRYGK